MRSAGRDKPAIDAQQTVGAILRAAREFEGLSLQDLATATRIRPAYLSALEDGRTDQLPSRPFAIGYVRACATTLGLDPDAIVERFKRELPPVGEGLRAPVGVSRERDPRLSLAAGGAAVVVCAVLVWNLAQHAMATGNAPAAAAPVSAAPRAVAAKANAGPVVLSASKPAPKESEVPDPYVTPGLPAADAPAGADAAAAPAAAPPPAAAVAAVPPASPQFAAHGPIFGAAPDQSVVTLQAVKPASLVVRGADGAVYFARQLAAGEAYRAPTALGLTVDVSDPTAFAVYAGGLLKGALDAKQTPIGRLSG